MLQDRIKASDLIREVMAFALTLAWAILFQWEARDVIWGLWISSLVVGYGFILFAIVSMLWGEEERVLGSRQTLPGAELLKGRIIAGLMLLAFFSVHFCMFHYGHSFFLNLFFPLAPEDKTYSGSFFRTISICLKLYWPIVLSTFISRLPDFRPQGPDDEGSVFLKPYASVIRMHILIFVFAGLSVADIAHYALYPVLAFYFFPWAMVFRSTGRAGQARA